MDTNERSKLLGTLIFGVLIGLATYGVIDSFGAKGVIVGIVIGAYVAAAFPWMLKDNDGAKPE